MTMCKKRKYSDYSVYLSHQMQKTSSPLLRKKWQKKFNKKVSFFRSKFSRISQEIIAKDNRVLCLGARMGEEVAAFNEIGLGAIGIDLVENLPLVIKGDFNDLNFEKNSFDIVYTNAFDHAWNIDCFFSQIDKVLKTGGYLIMDVFVKNFSHYEVIYVDQIDDVIQYVNKNTNMKLVQKNENLPKIYKRSKSEIQLIFKKH